MVDLNQSNNYFLAQFLNASLLFIIEKKVSV